MAAEIRGKPLRPNASIEHDYIEAILPLVRRMCDETRKVLERILPAKPLVTMDANPASQARIELAKLREKYTVLFSRVAKKATKRMVDRTLKYSSVSLGMSLKDMSEHLTLRTDVLTTPRMQEVITAATQEAAGLIKLIPEKYLTDVGGQVMRSITTGGGMNDLVPYLKVKYEGNIRHARLVAMDQTRKSLSTVNATRMQGLGIETYIWMHVGGSQEPRLNHLAMDGKEYRLDDPPVIGVMYGQEVRGNPGFLPNCRCQMRPILKFD